jgi:hypothetical protein
MWPGSQVAARRDTLCAGERIGLVQYAYIEAWTEPVRRRPRLRS